MADGTIRACIPGREQGPPSLTILDGPPGEARFWAWRDSVAAFWDVAVSSPDEARCFRASAQAFHLSTGIVVHSAASGYLARRTATIVARMGVDHILAQMRRRGAQTGEAAGGALSAGPGDICFLDMAQTYAAATTDYEAITLVMPRDRFLLWLGCTASPHGLVLGGDTALGRLLGGHLTALLNAAPTLPEAETVAAINGAVALAAACAGPSLAVQTGIPKAAAPAVLLAIRHYINSNLATADLSADAIAVRFGLSRSALYRLFEPLGGVADFVRKRRLARAYDDLVRTAASKAPQRIAEVGSTYGFESSAVFSRAFRREFGCAPREIRFAAGRPAPVRSEGSPGAVLHDWLLRLDR